MKVNYDWNPQYPDPNCWDLRTPLHIGMPKIFHLYQDLNDNKLRVFLKKLKGKILDAGCGNGRFLSRARETSIHFIVLSAGELSGSKGKRRQECRESAKLLDAKLIFFNYPDGSIPVNVEIIDKLRSYVKKVAPHTVFTLYPNDTHQDHRNASKVTISSCENVDEVLFYEIPSTERDFHPNVFYDVTDYFNLKERSLRCHRTQRKKVLLEFN